MWTNTAWLAGSSCPNDLRPLLNGIVEWASECGDVEAVAAIGSVARGTADEWSDLDVVVVTNHRERMWAERERIARTWRSDLVAFVDIDRLRPFLGEAIYGGMQLCDVALDESSDDLDSDAIVVVDRGSVRDKLPSSQPSGDTSHPAAKPSSDTGSWLWLWDVHRHVRRGHLWHAHAELALFARHILLPAVLSHEGVASAGDGRDVDRLRPGMRSRVDAVLPAGKTDEALLAALAAAALLYRDVTTTPVDIFAVASEVLSRVAPPPHH